ncbi:VWA domain-containing protein [Nocardia crassostreae]|uniref:VWA domain-containing protein n=1 Tax=Nocardia crassostreae TaxID=53428 RepID=UPI000831AA9A|nr:vWA domain-containing protein [Nocardia crassostreae]
MTSSMRGLMIAGALLLTMLSTSCGDGGPSDAAPAVSGTATAVPDAADISADYIVLLDISGSMAEAGRYAAGLEALPRLLDGLSEADRVSFHTFDATVHPIYSGSGRPAPELLAMLPAAPVTDAVTDLGPAITTVLDELERSGRLPITTVVLITDGLPNPPDGSPYADLSAPA